MYACSVDEWNSCMPLLVSLCCIVMCYRNDEMSKQTRQGFPVWETPRQCKSKGVIDSSIIPHHWPGHPLAPTPLGLYKPATQQQRIQPHTPLYADTTAWQGIFQIISFHWLARTRTDSIFPAQKEWIVLGWKAKIIIHLKCRSHGWVNYPGIKARRGCRTNCESEPECLWMYQLYLFFPPAFPQLPPQHSPLHPSTHTHTHNGLHGYQGDGNVTLNCCHLCWASINKSMKKIVIKNTWIAACTDWERWTDWSRENRARWKEKL